MCEITLNLNYKPTVSITDVLTTGVVVLVGDPNT